VCVCYTGTHRNPHLIALIPGMIGLCVFRLVQGKAIRIQAWTGAEGCRRSRLQESLDVRHMKVARLSALGTGRLYLPGDTPGTHFC
jgi:hypothetical protein